MKRSLLIAVLLLAPTLALAKKDARPVLDGAAAARAITVCHTPLSDLEARLGAPTRDGRLHSDRIVSWITEWEPLAKYLAVMVDARGIVVDVYWDVPTEIPWTPTNQCSAR
jgi:hypothetical protein